MSVIITLEEAKAHLSLWLKAEKKVAISGKSYKIGMRTLTRADLGDIMTQIKYWERKVSDLESGKKGGGPRGYSVDIYDC